MNLLTDIWLPVITHMGEKRTIKLAEISDPSINELDFNRMDFQGAGYQLLIGLLQTTFAPVDVDEWTERLTSPPSTDELQQAFDKVSYAFELDGDGVRFMQEFNFIEDKKTLRPIEQILIGSPGQSTIEKNIDFFVKRDTVKAFSPTSAIIALMAIQLNATEGGPGYYTSIRGGGGGMMTLVRPTKDRPLWEKLWWNVINREFWEYDDVDLTNEEESKRVFPWLVDNSQSKTQEIQIFSTDEAKVHPLYVFWAMPRRIKLVIEQNSEKIIDDFTGEVSPLIVTAYHTKQYGNHYLGDWSENRPFTPYKSKIKQPDVLLPVKVKNEGITYKIWHALTLKDENNIFKRAQVIAHANDIQSETQGEFKTPNSIWVLNYNTKSFSALGIYSAEMPMMYLKDYVQVQLLANIKEILELAERMLSVTNLTINKAKDLSQSEPAITRTFWQRSQPLFFGLIAQASENQGELPPRASLEWLRQMRLLSEQIYDEQVLSVAVIKQRHMEQRNKLTGLLYGNESAKQFAERQRALLEDQDSTHETA